MTRFLVPVGTNVAGLCRGKDELIIDRGQTLYRPEWVLERINTATTGRHGSGPYNVYTP